MPKIGQIYGSPTFTHYLLSDFTYWFRRAEGQLLLFTRFVIGQPAFVFCDAILDIVVFGENSDNLLPIYWKFVSSVSKTVRTLQV